MKYWMALVLILSMCLVTCGYREKDPYSLIKKPGFTLTDAGGFVDGTRYYVQGTFIHTRIHCERIAFSVGEEDFEPVVGRHYNIASWFLPGTPLPWKMKLIPDDNCTDYDVCGHEIWSVEPLPYWEGGE